MKKILLILGGANPVHFDRNNDLSSDELKYTISGVISLIPASLSALGTFCFVAPYIEAQPLRILSAITVAVAVLFINTHFLLSHRKKKFPLLELLSISFILRVALSLMLALFIGHSLLAHFYTPAALEQGNAKQAELTRSLERQTSSRLESVEKKASKLFANLEQTREKVRCNEELLYLERNGIKKRLGCGTSSGNASIPGAKNPEEHKILKRLTSLRKQERNLQERLNVAMSEEKALTAKLTSSPVEDHTSPQVITSIQVDSRLDELFESNPVVRTIYLMTLCLFCVLDLIPLLFKILSPAGPYDHFIRTHEHEIFLKYISKQKALSLTQPQSLSKDEISIIVKNTNESLSKIQGLEENDNVLESDSLPRLYNALYEKVLDGTVINKAKGKGDKSILRYLNSAKQENGRKLGTVSGPT